MSKLVEENLEQLTNTGMATVITDKTDLKSIRDILLNFKNEDQVDIYSSDISPIDSAIVLNDLKILNVIIQKADDALLFVLNNGTIIQRLISQNQDLYNADLKQLENFENIGDGVFWTEIPTANISLKSLIQEEIAKKFKLQIA